jgi:hypothetical protein
MAVERHLRALEEAVRGPLSLGELVERMRHSGFGLVLIFVCLPFLQPVPMGGLSTLIGPFVALQGLALARGRREPWLPGWLARRRLSEKVVHVLIGTARLFFRQADRLSRPRWRALARAEGPIGLAIAACGLLLCLPFPIPLSNMVCAFPVVMFSLSLLEEDGAAAVLGWAGMLLSALFHAGVAALGAEGTRAAWARLFP